jgi:hypothetical protein
MGRMPVSVVLIIQRDHRGEEPSQRGGVCLRKVRVRVRVRVRVSPVRRKAITLLVTYDTFTLSLYEST